MTALEPVHSIAFAGVRLNLYHANAGEGLPRHEHDYPHLTMCLAGSCAVRKDGKQVVLMPHKKPLYLAHLEWHEIEALEGGTIFQNVYAEVTNERT